MISYIIALIAAAIFLINPLAQIIFSSGKGPQAVERPHLNSSLLAIEEVNATAPECGNVGYNVRILRREPLIVYLEGFLSDEERSHLLKISDPIFESSTITHDGDTTSRDTAIRDSQVALLPRTDTVRCIEARARAFQGWRDDVWIERLRTQRYTSGGHYSHHFDWSANVNGWGRVSSFMAWVDASDGLEGGGTEFPLVRMPFPSNQEWCKYLECRLPTTPSETKDDDHAGSGVVFKPIPGNAVYWENFAHTTGRGYEETWHAGLPVDKGVKVGLNIWSFGRI